MPNKKILLIFSAIIAIGIAFWFFSKRSSKNLGETNISFYSWNNNFELDSSAYNFLTSNKIKHLRVKLAELSWDGQKVVVDNHLNIYSYNKSLEQAYFQENKLTPVVFIDNDLFYEIDSAQIPQMASLAKRAIQIHSINSNELFPDRWGRLYFSLNPKSVDNAAVEKVYNQFLENIVSYEFDCDWTEKTRDKYFYFLQNVKDTLNKKIESTLRLHQYKFRDKMGIPPVDAVNLMCYNVGDVTSKKETNSIFNSNLVLEYMKNQDQYPVPLNIAFPTFQWTVVFRNNQFYRLVQGDKILESKDQIQEIGTNTYKLKSDVYIDWRTESLREGDVVRVEYVLEDDIQTTYSNILKETKEKPKEVIFFDLNSSLSKDNYHELEKILHR
jgi:hypothetical protein